MMRLLILCLFLSFSFYSCDDGDVITVDLDFEDTFEACGDLVFYKTKTDPNESLSFQITSPSTELEDFIEVSIENNIAIIDEDTLMFDINDSNPFNYRTYNEDPSGFFCEDVPPSNVEITSDQDSTTGTATFTIALLEDDNDGIPAEDEDENIDGDNDPSTNPTDTDGDGIPNYLDADDDGDNVPTENEIDTEDADGDGDPLTNGLNTDADFTNGDNILDYLDPDDDADGVLTRDEENESQDQNPRNDLSDNINNPNLPDYLNPAISTTVAATAYRLHEIQQTFTISLLIENIQIDTLTDTEIFFGTLDGDDVGNITSSSRELTPDFE